MKVALNWLAEYCQWDWSLDELVERLTMSGTEVEDVHRTGCQIDNVVTGKILSFVPHPNADRLRLCQVDDGSGTPRQIVCGAKNFVEGDMVPVALPGAELPNGMKIKKSKLRGETSEGMLCAAGELNLPDTADGLMILDASLETGKPISDIMDGDDVLELEVTPNRADLLSYKGIAKELAALGASERAFTWPKNSKINGSGAVDIKVEEAEGCPRYTGTLLKSVKVGESPDWMKTRLEAVGLRPINNVVDITNYVLLETGQPLHAFDLDTFQDAKPQVGVRRAKDGEEIVALDGETYQLDALDLVITNADKPVAIAGVMGGEETGVTEKTTSVVLESASFQPASVRRTSRRLALISDSSYRFERGVAPQAVDLARERAIELLKELCGATVEGDIAESAPVSVPDVKIELRATAITRVMGRDVEASHVESILTGLGCEKLKGDASSGSEATEWSIPSNRPDLTREIDLIEEVARIEGLASVEGKLPAGVAARSDYDAVYDLCSDIRSFLTSNGYHEMMTSSLLGADEKGEGIVELTNPLTADHAVMRPDLASSVLPCIQHNLSREQHDLRCFEIGKTYAKKGSKATEQLHLFVTVTGKERGDHWSQSGLDADFYTLKGVVDSLKARFPQLKLPQTYGAVSGALRKKFGIKVPVFAAELTIPNSWKSEAPKYAEVSNQPSVRRDMALVVDQKIQHDEILTAITRTKITELESVECFDLFEDSSGEKLSEDKKSLAFSLVFRAADKTLKDKDVDKFFKKVLGSVQHGVGAELR